MMLPIDWSKEHRPIMQKRLDEETLEFGRWFVWGEHPDGTVAVCNSNDADIALHMPREKAERLVAVREDFITESLAVFNEESWVDDAVRSNTKAMQRVLDAAGAVFGAKHAETAAHLVAAMRTWLNAGDSHWGEFEKDLAVLLAKHEQKDRP